MAEIRLTPSQRAAVEAPIMDLLVSAAAGSGKTAVLSQRILRLLADPSENADLSRMLIVTFTKASASELRVRIAGALKKELAFLRELPEEEKDEAVHARYHRLAGQLDKVDFAEISTIHSFCYSLIKKHFAELGLSASLRIADEVESELLMMRCMEETVDALYEEDEAFVALAENLIELQDDRLSEILLGFYKKFAATPEGIGLVHRCAEGMKGAVSDFSGSVYGDVLRRTALSFAAYYGRALEGALAALSEDGKAVKAYYAAFEEDVRFLKGWERLFAGDYFAAAEAVSAYASPRLGSYRGEKPASVAGALLLRKDFQGALKELKKRFFSFTADSVALDAAESADYCETLYRTLSAFSQRYDREKRRLAILDYNDLESLAHKLLIQDGHPTPLAEAVSDRYDALFIDEYQDTNQMQDEIFAAISRENRFLVGDIKQSIYGFRGAMPGIFSNYRESFPDYREGEGQRAAKIFLSENFRSDRSVIDYANRIFEKLFHNNSGRVPYLPEDALVCSRPAEEDSGLPARFLLANRDSTTGEGEPLTEEAMVADEILSLLAKGVKPSDIVILLRNMNAADKFRQALSDRAVACQSGKNEDSLLERPEILLLVALLRTVDNPTRDIDLAAVLKSPLFGFTLGELIRLRQTFPAETLYASLTACLAAIKEASEEGGDRASAEGASAEGAPAEGETGFQPSENSPEIHLPENFPAIREKGEAFLAFLARARRYAERKSSDKVVRYLLRVTPLRAVAVKNGKDSSALSLFYDFARNFESRGFRGIHGLVRRIQDILSDKAAPPPVVSRAADLSAVRIMTIHQSKGCEFDYVFLSDTARRFNTREKSASLVYEKELGIGMKLRSSDGFLRFDTLIRQAIAAKIEENALDEEMRILYVALTRAKKQLIVTAAKGGARNTSCEDFIAEAKIRGGCAASRLFAESSSYAEWLALAYPEQPFAVIESLNEAGRFDGVAKESVKKSTPPVPEALLAERLAYRYPAEAIAGLPAKLSVSRLYPGILDDEGEELIRSEKADFERLPLFMQETLPTDGAERGTATHLFMQFCDFEKVAANGVEAEIGRLVSEAFLTRGIADLIERQSLSRFFSGELFQRISEAKEVYREKRFNVRLPASEFTLDPEKAGLLGEETILVQGVVDCLFVEKDGSVCLVDYKTDRTPRERKAAEALLRKRYTAQLSYYRRALESLMGIKIAGTWLYSFSLGDIVEIR